MSFPIDVEVPAAVTPEARLRPPVAFRFVYHATPADYKALCQMWGFRGAGSYHPCGLCANVLGILQPDQITDPAFVHYSCKDPARFDVWTHDRL